MMPHQDDNINFLNEQQEELQPPQQSKKRVVFFVIAIIMLLFSAGCLTKALFFKDENAGQYDPETLEPLKADGFFNKLRNIVFNPDAPLEGQKDDRINILVLGQGGPGHDGPYLTDTIIIASIKPSTGQVALISIPRDLGVRIGSYGFFKINHANAYGESEQKDRGIDLAEQVIEQTFDLNINYVVRIDFAAFEEIIDEVGGVSIDVDKAFSDSQYPAANFEFQTVSFNQGVQTMSGETALKFVRSRHGNNGEGSDFARSKRQQKVLLALKEKLLSFQTLANPARLNHIIDALQNHILTDMEFSDMIALMKLSKELNTDEIINFTLDDSPTGYLVNATSFMLIPKSGTFKEINQKIQTIFETPTEILVNNTPEQHDPGFPAVLIEIQNGTWQAGLASRVRKTLTDNKFTIGVIGNTTERPQTQSGIYILSKSASPDVADALSKTLHIPIKQTLPSGEKAVGNKSEILVVLGEDYKEE